MTVSISKSVILVLVVSCIVDLLDLERGLTGHPLIDTHNVWLQIVCMF